MKFSVSTKSLQINKAQKTAMIFIASATAVTIFCLVSTKALLNKGSYQRRVLNARRQAVDQLKANIQSANALVAQYQVFNTSNPTNIIGGRNTTDKDAIPPDGDNGRIVLDALPSKYDFPALITSLTGILKNDRIASPGISSSDQTATLKNDPESNPQPIAIPLTISGTANYKYVRTLIHDLERSIRPFDITNLSLRGSEKSMSVTIVANTYYQVSKSLAVGNQEVK